MVMKKSSKCRSHLLRRMGISNEEKFCEMLNDWAGILCIIVECLGWFESE